MTSVQLSRDEKLATALRRHSTGTVSADWSQPIAFGQAILMRRRLFRLTRHDLACLANVNDSTISIIEDGQATAQELPAIRATAYTLALRVAAWITSAHEEREPRLGLDCGELHRPIDPLKIGVRVHSA